MASLRVCYKHGVRFDKDYYLTKHIPLAGGIFGPYGLKGVEMMEVQGAVGGGTPPYQFIFTAHFDTLQNLEKALQSPRIGEIIADVPNYYAGAPDMMIGDATNLPI